MKLICTDLLCQTPPCALHLQLSFDLYQTLAICEIIHRHPRPCSHVGGCYAESENGKLWRSSLPADVTSIGGASQVRQREGSVHSFTPRRSVWSLQASSRSWTPPIPHPITWQPKAFRRRRWRRWHKGSRNPRVDQKKATDGQDPSTVGRYRLCQPRGENSRVLT